MSIGLKRGTVYLEDHSSEWEEAAARIINLLKDILKGAAVDIQHIGSTSIKTIKAKPIIDIAVAVDDFWDILEKKSDLQSAGIVLRLDDRPNHLLFVMGDFDNDFRTHHIHVVLRDSEQWRNYIDFRDYLNANAAAAKEYEKVKIGLAEKHPLDRAEYTAEKYGIISALLLEAKKWRKRQ